MILVEFSRGDYGPRVVQAFVCYRGVKVPTPSGGLRFTPDQEPEIMVLRGSIPDDVARRVVQYLEIGHGMGRVDGYQWTTCEAADMAFYDGALV